MNSFERTQRLLARRGIFTLFDFHQDMLTRATRGVALPTGSSRTTGTRTRPRPASQATTSSTPRSTAPTTTCGRSRRARTGSGSRTTSPRGGGGSPRAFAGSHGAGYDIFNEPWPGARGPRARARRDVRRAASTRPPDRVSNRVYGDPGDARTSSTRSRTCSSTSARRRGSARSTTPMSASASMTTAWARRRAYRTRPTRPRLCKDQGERRVFHNAEAHVGETGATLLMTEFGDVQDATIHRRVTDLADEYRVGWIRVGLVPCGPARSSSTRRSRRRRQPEDGGARCGGAPYPRIVAGTPTSFWSIRGRKRFEASFSTWLPDGRRAPPQAQRDLRVAAALRA